MEINKISKISHHGDQAEVLLDVTFDPEVAHRWELVNPQVLTVYAKQGENYEMDYMELLDGDLIVHSFEFNQPQIQKIIDFFQKNNIGEKLYH